MNLALSVSWRLRVLAAALVIPPLLHLVSLHRLASRFPARRRATAPPVDLLVYDVERWLRWLPRPWRLTCLKRAGVLYALLRYAGVAVELHIGVRRNPAGAFAAHAWLVRDGQVYLEPAGSEWAAYRVIAVVPESTTDARTNIAAPG